MFKSRYNLSDNKRAYSHNFMNMLNNYAAHNRELFKYLLFKYLLLSIGINIGVDEGNNKLNDRSKILLAVNITKPIRKASGNILNNNEHLNKYYDRLSTSIDESSSNILISMHLPSSKSSRSDVRKSIFLKKMVHIQHFFLQAYFMDYLSTVTNKYSMQRKIKFLFHLLQYNLFKFRKKSSILFRTISMIERVYTNINKLSLYLPFLKSSLKRMYGSDIDLVIKVTKYPYLNSSIFTQVLGVKLKDRRRSVINLVTRSVNLIKLPRFIKYNYTTNYTSLPSIKNYYNVINYNKSDNGTYATSITNALIGLKSKWITGIFLEAKGRLTQRYSIARSKLLVLNRGSIQNTESSLLLRPSLLLRNSNESNVQYTSLQDKRRIGVFGLKV